MKKWYLSKTAITSIVGIFVGAVASIVQVITGHEVLGLEEQAAIVLVITSAVALVLRFITNQTITL